MAADSLDEFIANIHPSTKLLSKGTVTVMDRTIPAVEVRNLYGQHIVWGMFSVDRGKFKGKLSNNAATEGVVYDPTKIISSIDSKDGEVCFTWECDLPPEQELKKGLNHNQLKELYFGGTRPEDWNDHDYLRN